MQRQAAARLQIGAWCRQASMDTCAGGQKDAAVGSSGGQKDAAAGISDMAADWCLQASMNTCAREAKKMQRRAQQRGCRLAPASGHQYLRGMSKSGS
jgi:hypothetical protein